MKTLERLLLHSNAERIGIYTKISKHDKTIAMKKKLTALKQTPSKEIPTTGGIPY
jgi:hypothetical protein